MAKLNLALLTTAGMVFLVTAIALMAGSEVLDDLTESNSNTTTYSKTGVSVVVYWSNQSNTSLSTSLVQSGTLTVTNGSGINMNLDNFTVNYNLGTIGIAKGTALTSLANGSTMTASFSYLSHPMTYNVTHDGNASLGEYASWFPTLALVVAAATVLGILGFLWKRD